jgi:hypothetical protein
VTVPLRGHLTALLVVVAGLGLLPPDAFAQADAPVPRPLTVPSPPARPPFHVRFDQYLENGYGPVALMESAAMGALDQVTTTPASWKRGTDGYVRRFASEAATTMIQESIEFGLNEALRQDANYPRCECTGGWRRAWHAVAWTALARSADGRTTFAVGHVTGAFAANVLQTTWQEGRSVKAGVAMGTALMALDATINLMREFWPQPKRVVR